MLVRHSHFFIVFWLLAPGKAPRPRKAGGARDRKLPDKHTSRTGEPKNDASDMGATLKTLGLAVIEAAFDLDKGAMDRTIRDFATQTSSRAGRACFSILGTVSSRQARTFSAIDAELLGHPAIGLRYGAASISASAMDARDATRAF